jgi:mannan endo-1,6-alpha-mannosidase
LGIIVYAGHAVRSLFSFDTIRFFVFLVTVVYETFLHTHSIAIMVQAGTLCAIAALSFVPVLGLDLNVDSTSKFWGPRNTSLDAKFLLDSIVSISSTLVGGMVSYYIGNDSSEIPGILPSPYYWWEGGAMFDTLIQYRRLTGDKQFDGIVSQALQFQQGPNSDFMPPNQTKTEGNDDQSTWALAAMSAAESEFPEAENGTAWLSLAEAVFNDQVERWDTQSCGGGLRWQIFSFNNGYNYKNSLANGNLFQLASRLARYTGNSTYSDWAAKIFDWTSTVGLIDNAWNVYDGSDTTTNCSTINHVQFSNSAGTYITGVAHMYNVTSGNEKWKTALDGLLNLTLGVFFPNGVATEIACETKASCTVDMKAFKGFLAHWLVDTIQVAPYTTETIMPLLTSSAQAAAAACNGDVCPSTWVQTSTTNVTTGLGEELSALSFVQALLVEDAPVPVTRNETSTSSGSSGGTATSAGSLTGTQTPTTSGKGTPISSTNVGAVVGAKTARMAVLAAGLGSMAWLVL